MKSINFVILGDFQIASELGKKGTTTDLSIFDRKSTRCYLHLDRAYHLS